MNPPPASDFFAYVIESPSFSDLYDERPGRNVLVQSLRLAEVPSVFQCAISRRDFCAAIDSGLKEASARLQPRLPLLHLSSYGHADGVPLSSGEVILWAELNELLRPVNKALHGRLVVSMSGCEGYRRALATMRPGSRPRLFSALLGSSQKTHWSEAAIGYAVFYHRLAQGAQLTEAVRAMNVGAGCEHFHLEWAESPKKSPARVLPGNHAAMTERRVASAAGAR